MRDSRIQNGGRKPGYAVIIPVCNEEACIEAVTRELSEVLEKENCLIVVGLNGCSDGSRALLEELGVLWGETSERGYGHGCMAAIRSVESVGIPVAGYIFCAGDGANDPRDIPRLIREHEKGAEFVVGNRTMTPRNWRVMGGTRSAGNLLFGFVVAVLSGRFYYDLGPLRLIDAGLWRKMDPRELTWGWTAEAQIVAARLKARIVNLNVAERPRLAGQQKVTGVSLGRTLRIAGSILVAALRVQRGQTRPCAARAPEGKLVSPELD